MSRKGQFKKGGGRVGGGSSSKALVRYRTKHVTRYKTRHVKAKTHRRRRGSHASGVTLGKVILAGAGLGVLLGDKSPVGEGPKKFFAETVPGGKTFGPEATFGALALVADRFLIRSPWIRAAGYVGLGMAALKLGRERSEFKWLGDEGDDDDFVSDVE